MAKHQYETGIIGNCSYLAHVHLNTNIAWMCWPRFDSSFVFGGLLDTDKGGAFTLQPEGPFRSRQYYLDNTNVLVTEVEIGEDSYRVTDFAPRFRQYDRYYKPLMLIRKLEVLKGRPRIRVICSPQGNYGEFALHGSRGSNHMEYRGLEDPLRLTTNIGLTFIDEEKYFVLNETKYLALTYGPPLEAPLAECAEQFLSKTIQYWRNWIQNTGIETIYQKEVIRSSLALKIHQYEDTGAIIAASTTSLPESPGSGRNWDYRYCWLRDAYYILQAFNNIGHFEELEHYFQFIENLTYSGKDRFQPLYGVGGETQLTERILNLAGYQGNSPVRIGNQASLMVQNDAYGQILTALLPLYEDQRILLSRKEFPIDRISDILDQMEQALNEPDSGLWEFRDTLQHHCYTFLFHWAGACAALKMSSLLGSQILQQKAEKIRAGAIAGIEACYDPAGKVYREAWESPYLDASTLQLVLMHYLDPASQRARDHVQALEKGLKAPGGLFYRYRHPDDFGAPETTFLVTAFWYVETLAQMGRLDEARMHFEELMGYSNHLGLFSEDVDAVQGSQWGNFPQAYSHVGVMNAVHRMARKLDRPIFL